MCKKQRCFLKKFTQLTKILHDCRSRRSRQIPSLLMKLKTQRKAENERRKCSLRRTLPSKARIHISCCSYFILIILLPHFLSCCSYYPTFWVIFKQFWCSVKTNMWTSSWISFSSLQARPIQLHPQLQQVRSVGSTSIQTLLKRLFCTLISGWWALIAEERIRTQLIAWSVSQVTTCHRQKWKWITFSFFQYPIFV